MPTLAFWVDGEAMEGPDFNNLHLTDRPRVTSPMTSSYVHRPLVLHGQDGHSLKRSAGQARYYHSQPLFELSGTLSLQAGDVPVTGTAWLDREWSSQPLAEDQQGWGLVLAVVRQRRQADGLRPAGQCATGYVTAAQVSASRSDAEARGSETAGSRAEAIDEDLLGLTRAERVKIQERLISLGYLRGQAYGVFGSATRNAIGRWQGDNRLEETSYLEAEQVRTLQEQARI